MADAYRVPKHALSIQLRTTHGGEEPVTVFLSEHVEAHLGPESPLDLFARERTFLPVELATGEICFVSREQIVTATLPPAPPAEDPVVPCTVAKVSIALVDGTRLEGGVAYELPDAHSRIQDHLNNPVSFLEVHTPDGVVLVNKRHIAHVSETT